MAKEFNYTDINQVSKKSVNKARKLEEQTNSWLAQHYAKIEEEKKQAEQKLQEEALSNARFSNSSPYMRNKSRVKAMQEQIAYGEKATTAVVTDVITSIVENALLLDVEEYAQLNPNYKTDIKNTVRSFLENADIEEVVKNKKTVQLIEALVASIPSSETGVYLSEEELVDVVKKSTPEELNQVIDELTGDIKSKVAEIVGKEQFEAAELEKDIENIKQASEEMKEIAQEELGVEEEPEIEEMAVEGEEELSEDEFEGFEDEELSEDEEDFSLEEKPEEAGEEDEYLEYQKSLTPGKVETEIRPDGTIKVTSFKEQFYHEVPRFGILESLALNEAIDMVNEGKKYNGDLAIANALVQLTIMETFNVTGLKKLNEQDYKKMLNITGKAPKRLTEEEAELGAEAAQPAHDESLPKEYTPEVETKDVFPAEEHQESGEVEAPLIESA